MYNLYIYICFVPHVLVIWSLGDYRIEKLNKPEEITQIIVYKSWPELYSEITSIWRAFATLHTDFETLSALYLTQDKDKYSVPFVIEQW